MYSHGPSITVIKGIPITTVILITCVVGIPLFMIKKPVYYGIPTTIILYKTPNIAIF